MAGEQPWVVVVDDDEDYRQIVGDLLATLDCRVAAFASRDEAWEFLREHTPRLIVTDLMMESLTAGFDFARQLRADPRFRTTPIIMLTAIRGKLGFDFTPRSSEEAAAMRIDAFFEKPPEPTAFLARVRALLAPAAGA